MEATTTAGGPLSPGPDDEAWRANAREIGCACQDQRKPCSYHEGYGDGHEAAARFGEATQDALRAGNERLAKAVESENDRLCAMEFDLAARDATIEELKAANDHLSARIEDDSEHKAAGHLWLATAWFRLAHAGEDDDGSLWRIVPVDDEQSERALSSFQKAIVRRAAALLEGDTDD